MKIVYFVLKMVIAVICIFALSFAALMTWAHFEDKAALKRFVLSDPTAPSIVQCHAQAETCACDFGDAEMHNFQIQVLPDLEPFAVSMPATYFNLRSTPKENQIRDAAFFQLNVETFAPWPKKVLHHGKYGPHANVLITANVPLKEMADLHVQHSISAPYGERVQLQTKFAQFGLEQINLPSDAKPWSGQEVFLSRKNGTINNLIHCDIPIEGRFPGCSQTIETPLADLKISYARKHLADWEGISIRLRGFMQCITEN